MARPLGKELIPMKAVDGAAAVFAAELRSTYKMRGILVQMAERGQLLELRCEMPSCYHVKGRRSFDPIGSNPSDWIPTPDHYRVSKSQGGKLEASNVRLGHKLCNNLDFGWRSRITVMLKKDMSLADIANALNRRKVLRSHGSPAWTAKSVRKAFVS